jgi:hypothetical protein
MGNIGMEPIEVTARFDEQGKITPVRFTWKGSVYLVESTGRRWQAEDGLHILVMVPGERVFELLFHAEETRWYLGRGGTNRMAA